MNKKFLAVIVILLSIVSIIAVYYAYQDYRMSEMDRYMKKTTQISNEFNSMYIQTNELTKAQEYDEAMKEIDQMISKTNEIISLEEKAYQYADGPYKECIATQ